jgi:signal transduction histidine kinase
MPLTSSSTTYREFLRSRWPSRTHLLALHAFAGSFVFVALDWLFTRQQARPPTLGALALLRLPWIAIPLAGELLRRRAPGWRFLPHAIVVLSVAWTWSSVLGYFAIGLEGSVLQAITLFACLVTTAALMPLTPPGRIGVFALMSLGYVIFDLNWPHDVPLTVRLADDAVVVAFAIIQVVVFQHFAAAQRRGLALRQRLERTVAALGASRQRAADAVAEIGQLAATVAHEVNNPLAAVKGNVRWLATDGTDPAQAAERTEVVLDSLQAIDRIAAIVADLKARSSAQDELVHREDPSAGFTLDDLKR